MLSFLFYYLLKTPHAYKKAQDEVDTVIGNRKITVEDMSKLPYITAIMRETLRLKPTAPLISVHPHPDKNGDGPVTLGGGKYVLQDSDFVALMLGKMQRDPKVYGPDADEFRPERMLDENFEKLPKNAWKPFGNGMRGCIGRPFAWQEALLVVAMLLQNFNLQMDNPTYDLRIKQTLTIKPKDFYMKASLRHGRDPTQLSLALGGTDLAKDDSAAHNTRKPKQAPVDGKTKPMHIFYGSNTGTCEAFARRLADDAIGYGFEAEIASLDSAAQNIPKDELVVFISASYEGQPPDNAAHFFEWLSKLEGKSLEGTNYAVFGCGHREYTLVLPAVVLVSFLVITILTSFQMIGLPLSIASPRQSTSSSSKAEEIACVNLVYPTQQTPTCSLISTAGVRQPSGLLSQPSMAVVTTKRPSPNHLYKWK